MAFVLLVLLYCTHTKMLVCVFKPQSSMKQQIPLYLHYMHAYYSYFEGLAGTLCFTLKDYQCDLKLSNRWSTEAAAFTFATPPPYLVGARKRVKEAYELIE